MKKLIALLLVFVTLISCLSLTAASENGKMPFKDVKSNSWYYPSVEKVWSKGIMSGVSDTEFNPNGSLSRAMFVTILGRMAGVSTTDFTPDKFPDTKKNTWYSPYIGWAVEMGVVAGFEDGSFKPNQNLTREQMAKAMSLYIDVTGKNMPRESTAPSVFTDDGKIANWAKTYVETLRRWGIVNGDSKGNYNPKASITRAEAATIIVNLMEAEEKAWQGYTPNLSDGFGVYGAKYLFDNPIYSAGTLECVLDSTGSCPALTYKVDDITASYDTLSVPNTTGISLSGLGAEPDEYSYIRISYKGDISAQLSMNNYSMSTTALTVIDGGEEDGWKIAYINLSDITKEEYIYGLLICPVSLDGFAVRYYAVFKNEGDMKGFDADKYTDYFNNYYLYSNADIEALDSNTDTEIQNQIAERINDILNSESAVTPKDITGTAYYISSIHGDDSNDGKSPNTPWKTFKNLYRYIGEQSTFDKLKAGDGVFLERGSVFYPQFYESTKKLIFYVTSGVTYGAYGKGEKPLITGALPLDGGNGNWSKTDYPNVWELDPEQIDAREDFRTYRGDIGNIVFNEGQYFGIKITPADDYIGLYDAESEEYQPFGDGKKTLNVGYVSSGLDYYEVGERDCLNAPSTLKNNLEFIHDRKNGRLYLYWDNGNPADYFDDIKISTLSGVYTYTTTHEVKDTYNVRFDNIAFKYMTEACLCVSPLNTTHDLSITNCEFGYANKTLDQVASGAGVVANVDGWYMSNCYCHDIGDGPMSAQGQSNTFTQNVVWENNVVTTSGCGIEIWNICNDGSGSYQKDIVIRNNILAYNGCGICQSGNFGFLVGCNVLNGYIYGTNADNCVFENNLIYKPNGDIYGTYAANDLDSDGWIIRDNTYIANTDAATLYKNYETFGIKHGGYGIASVKSFRYDEGLIKNLTALGLDTTGKYYTYSDSEYSRVGQFYYKFKFITDWYIKNPEKKPIVNPE